MTVYFCRYKYIPDSGLFVVAPTRGKAKGLFAAETDSQYILIESQIVKRGVFADCPHVINRGDPDLERYGLEYEEEP